jgi:molybdopterin/thiamine biosynthesis adenylyltransferase
VASYLKERHQKALGEVGSWISSNFPSAAELAEKELRALGGDPSWAGWAMPVEWAEEPIYLLLDSFFPYSLPRIQVLRGSPLWNTPHVEKTGRLCLGGDGARVDALNPIAIVIHQLNEAQSLIKENIAGKNREDYVRDFLAYWRRHSTPSIPIRSLISTNGTSRVIKAWYGQNFYFLADTEQACFRWLANRYGPDESRETHDALAIWIERLPTPDEYPDSVTTLRKLLDQASSGGLPLFDDIFSTAPKTIIVVISGLRNQYDVATVAVIVSQPPKDSGKGRKVIAPVTQGFRPGRVPLEILALRYKVFRHEVEQVDEFKSRSRPDLFQSLADKKVAIIGCGSLGAGVAKMLLQSNVGALALIDPEHLGWPNISRHELGADFIGEFKASALATRYRKMFPHVRDVSAHNVSWQKLVDEREEFFADFDLIMSLTGEWNSESSLNDFQRWKAFDAPIIYGWLEENAAAAHALAIGTTGSCFRCGFSSTGKINIPATFWPKQEDFGCAGTISVYGAIELGPAQSLISELAVDVLLNKASPPVRRAWLAPLPSFSEYGGAWHPTWSEAFGDPKSGGMMKATAWPLAKSCPCHPI